MKNPPPRVLIEEWLPAAAIGVECIRERSTGQQPPDKRLHVWWARRPLTVSRAAVLASLLPANFPRDVFERLLGFWGSSKDLVYAQETLDWARQSGARIENPHGERAFRRGLRPEDLTRAHKAASHLWGEGVKVIDPMAGGGSIPLEAARLGFQTFANEYNPVACSVLEATVDYPFRYGEKLGRIARSWGKELRKRFNKRMERFYPKTDFLPPHCYIFARTVPCPDTQFHTPLVPDWHLLKPKSGQTIAAEPLVDKENGKWTVRIREIGGRAGQLTEAPKPTYGDGKGISLFTSRQIPPDYIKAKAQMGDMKSALYAVAVKTPQGLKFQPPEPADLKAIEEAEKELARLRGGWEKANLIPTERIPAGDKTGEPITRGIITWADMFSPRQLLSIGILVQELRTLCSEAVKAEENELGEAVTHLLALALDKFINHNCSQTRWENTHAVIKGKMDRHDYAFKSTYGELAPCNAGTGLQWAIDNVLEAYEEISKLPRHPSARSVEISLAPPPVSRRSRTAASRRSWLTRPMPTTSSTRSWRTSSMSG